VDCAESEGLYETSAEQLAADQEVYRQRAQALQRTMQLAPTTPRTDSAYTRVIGNQDRRFNPTSSPTASTPFFSRITQPPRPPPRNDQPTGPSASGFPDAFQRGGRTFQGQTAPGADQFNYNGNRNFVQSSTGTPSGRGSSNYQVTGPASRSTTAPTGPRGRGVQSQFRFGSQDTNYSGQASFNVVSSTVRAPPARRPTGPGREDFSAAESGRANLQPYRQYESGELNYPPGVNPNLKVTSTPQLQPKKKFQSTAFPQYTVSSSYRGTTTPQPVEKEQLGLAETASFASNRGSRFSFGTSAKGQDTQYESEPSFESRVVSNAPNNILTTTSTPNALQKSYFDFNRPRFVADTERTTASSSSASATPTPFYRKYQDILRSKEATATPTRPTFSTSTPFKGTTKYVELQRSRTVSYSAQSTVPASQPTRETPHDPPTTRYITLGRIVPKSATVKPTTSTPPSTTEPSTYITYPTTLPPVEVTTVSNNAPLNSLRSLELGAPLPQNEEPPQNHTTPSPQGTYLALYFATEETNAPNTEVPSTAPTAPEAPVDKLSISDVLLLPHANENFTNFAKDGESQNVPASLTQLTRDSYSSLFAETEPPVTTTTPAPETTPLDELDEPDITSNSNDLNVEQSRGIVEPEIPNSIAERPAKLPSSNLPPIGESTDLRELAQIFARALSAYLDDPESFRRVLAEVRPTEPPPTEASTERAEPTSPSHSDESSVTKEKDEVLLFSDELKGPPAKKRPSNALYQTAIPYVQPVVTTTPEPTTEPNTFPTGFATTAGISSTTLPTIDLEAPLQRLETLLDSQSRYYSSLEGQTTISPDSANYTSIAADVNSLIAILSSLNESWTDYPLTAAAATDDTYFPSGPSAPDNGLPRYGGFQNNSSYKPYGSDLSSTAEPSTTPGGSTDYTTTVAPESANYEIQKENLEKIDSALGSFAPEDLNQLAVIPTGNASNIPPSAGDIKQTQEIRDPSNSLSNRDHVLETAGSQAHTSKDRYLPQSSPAPNSYATVSTTKRPRYEGPIFVTPSRASPTVTTRATSPPTTTTTTTTSTPTRRPSTTSRIRITTLPATTQTVSNAGHRFRANKYLASQDLRARPTVGSVPVTVAQSKLLSKPTSQPRLEASLDTTRRREEAQRPAATNGRLTKSALQEARVPTHQLSLIANGKRLPSEDKLNAHKVMSPLDINYELTTTASTTRLTPSTLVDLLTTLLPTLAPTTAFPTKPTTAPPTTTPEAAAPTTYHPVSSRSSPQPETSSPLPVNKSAPSFSSSMSLSVSMTKSKSDDLAVSSSSSIIPPPPQVLVANTSKEMMAEAKSMFGHLNATMTATLMNMLKEAETNMTIRRLVLLLVNDHHRKMNVSTQEARRQLLEALLNPPNSETRSAAASGQVSPDTQPPAQPTSPASPSPTPEIIKRETTTEKPAPTRRKPTRRANKSHLKGKAEGVYSSRRSASRPTTTSTSTTTSTTTRRPDLPTTNAVLATILPNSSEDMTLASSDSRAVELLRSLYSLAAQWG